MKGLLIKPTWGNKILSGEKVWEIRSKETSHRGHTELLFSGTSCRFGSVDIVDCIHIPRDKFQEYYGMHKVAPGDFDISSYYTLYAWVMANPKRHLTPIPYVRKHGQVVWVNL